MNLRDLTQKEIIELLEGDGKIMEFRIKYDNLPVWPLIRNHALDIIEKSIYKGGLITNEKKVTIDKKIKHKIERLFFLIKICLKSKVFNHGKIRKRTVLVFPNRNYMRDGHVHENVFGHFIIDRDNTLLVRYYDNKYRWYESEADTIFREGVYSLLYIFDDLIGKKRSRYDREIGKEIARFISERIGNCDSNVNSFIEDRVSYLSSMVRQRELTLEKICNKTNPRYVVLSEAVYSYFAAECHFFNKRKIPVIELEHAMLYEGHRAYYFADSIFYNEEYKLYLPSMLAVWSEYCKKSIHVNTCIEVVGNPEFYYSYNRDFVACKKNLYKKKLVLYNVNCLPYEIPKIDEFIDEFSSLAGEEYLLVLRFHPLNRDYREHFEKFTEKYNVAIDDSEGIYCALAKCDYLISDFSTIVYEALACGVRVFTDDRESFIDENLLGEIECFSSVDELLGLIETEGKYVDSDMYKTLFFGEDKDVVDLYEVYVQSNQNVAV